MRVRTSFLGLSLLFVLLVWMPKMFKKDEERNLSETTHPRVEVSPSGLYLDRDPPESASGRHGATSSVKVQPETWHDPVGKAGRARTRIVRSDFKYKLLRYDERVWSEGGAERVDLVTVSVADHLLVKLKNGVDPAAFKKALAAAGLRLRAFHEGEIVLVEINDPLDADSQQGSIEKLQEMEGFVAYAEPDYLVFPSLKPDDADFSTRMWPLDNLGVTANSLPDADIDAAEAWDVRNSASSVIVAVTDTGVRYTHEDLADNMWRHPVSNDYGIDTYDEDSDPMDEDGHGTHVAGTIGARGNNAKGVAGVAWNVQLMALRFLGASGGATSDAIRVINYARENGADIINASWGGNGESLALRDAILECNNAGILFVAAAGNTGTNTDITPHFPSSFPLPNIVSVGATDSRDRIASFSNFGYATVDLTAPGVAIWSCDSTADNAYRYLSGTSMAVPHVSGALALARAHFPAEETDELAVRLLSSVDPVPGHAGEFSSGGRLNLYRLLTNTQIGDFHDDFGNPYAMNGCRDYWCWSNRNATREVDEDLFSPDTGQKSLWFKWVAPADGLVSFTGSAWGGDISVVAFAGSDRTNLRRLVDNFSERPTMASTLHFYVEEGKEYRFSLDSRLDINQVVAAYLEFAPEYDFFDEAIVIDASPFKEEGLMCGATAEPFEVLRPHAGIGRGESIWWQWMADSDGPFTITTRGSGFDSVLAVYTGEKSKLTEIASNDDRNALDYTSEVTFNAVMGTTYHIAVDAYRSRHAGTVYLSGYKAGSLQIHSVPQDTVASLGQEVEFHVVATGDDLEYFWHLDGIRLPWPANRTSLLINPVQFGSYGDYKVEVRSGDQVVERTWSLGPPQAVPFVEIEPRDTTVVSGGTLSLAPIVGGTEPLSFQWYKDGSALPGLSGRVLQIAGVNFGDRGDYRLEVTNSLGSVTTREARVVVQEGAALEWVQRLPGLRSFAWIDGVSYNNRIHAVTAEGLWLSGAGLDSLQAANIPGLVNPHMIRIHGSTLVAIGNRVAGGPFLYDRIAASTNGKAWTQINTNLPSGKRPSDFASNGTSAVIIADGLIYFSLDLTTWQLVPGYTAGTFNGLEWKDDKFVAIKTEGIPGSSGHFEWVTSNDGQTWTDRVDSAATPTGGVSLQAVNGRLFLGDGFDTYRTSLDGLTWTYGHRRNNPMDALVFDGEKYVSFGGLASTDGLTWFNTWAYTGIIQYTRMFAHRDGFVRFISGSANPHESDDPLDYPWSDPVTSPLNVTYADLIQLGSSLRQVSVYGDQQLHSDDGVSWRRSSFTTGAGLDKIDGRSVSHDGSNYWVLGLPGGEISGGRLYSGPGPSLLTEIALPAFLTFSQKDDLAQVRARQDHLLVAGGGTAVASQDGGTTWNTAPAVASLPGTSAYVATDTGFVVTTTDRAVFSKDGGLTWQTHMFSLSGHRSGPVIGQVSYFAGEVVVLDKEGYLRISSDDGSNWSILDLGGNGWASVTHYKGNIYVLNRNGMVLMTSDRSTTTTDGGLTFVGEGVDLEGYGESLFAVMSLQGAGNYALYQSGPTKDVGLALNIEGLDSGAIYSPGTELDLRWDFTGENATPARIDVYLDGSIIHSSTDLSGGFGLVVPESGGHHVAIVGTSTDGMMVAETFPIFSRVENMNLITSPGGAGIFGQEIFQGALYVAMNDGRILRTGDGENFDLATNLPQPPQALLVTEDRIGIFTRKALYLTADGMQWKAIALSSISSATDSSGKSPTVTKAKLAGDKFFVSLSYGGSFYSDNGIVWHKAILEESSYVSAVCHENTWLGRAPFASSSAVMVAGEDFSPRLVESYLGSNPQSVGAHAGGFVAGTGGGIHHSENGFDWQACDLPVAGAITVRKFTNVEDRIFAEYGSPARYLVSTNGHDWSEASRIPDTIQQGIWWSGNSMSIDGITWTQSGPTGAEKNIGFLGTRRVFDTTVTGKRRLAFAAGEAMELMSPELLFTPQGLPWEYGTFVPNSSMIGPGGLWHAFEKGSFTSRFSVRGSDGTWSAPAVASHVPTAYFGGKFYLRANQLSYYASSNLLDWQLINPSLTTTNDLTLQSITGLPDALYLITYYNIHRSTDGINWTPIYLNGTDGPRPKELVSFGGQLVHNTSDRTNSLLIRDSGTGLWSKPAVNVPSLSNGSSTTFVMSGRLHVRDNLKVHSTADFLSWETKSIPIDPGATGPMVSSPLQTAVSHGGNEGDVAILEEDGQWHAQAEIGEIASLINVAGRVVHHRFNQMWIGGLTDVGISVTGLTYERVSLNRPMTVGLELRNHSGLPFSAPEGTEIRLWALAGGVMNYQTRALLGTIGLETLTIPGNGTTVLNRVVQLPDGTPPGLYTIAAELRKDGGMVDDYAANNISSSRERLRLAGRQLTLNSNGNGSIMSDNFGLVYSDGALVALTANAGKGAVFTGWEGDSLGSRSQITITMDSDKTVEANFIETAGLQLFIRGKGSVNGLSERGLYPLGSTAVLDAVPADGWIFRGWSGAHEAGNSQATVLIDGQKTLIVTFEHPLVSWNAAHFNSTEMGQAEISGDLADPDHDGLNNWQEYLHGSDPRSSASRGRLSHALTATHFTMIFTRNTGALGARVSVMGSRDLVTWDRDLVTERIISTSGGIETVEARIRRDSYPSSFLTFSYDYPLANWKSAHFSSTELEQPEVSGDLVDPDHDGLTNWQEYLHGSDPRSSASRGRLSHALTPTHFTMIFTRNTGALGGKVTAMGSRDLVTWDRDLVTERVLSTSGGIVTVEASIRRDSYPSGFLALSYDGESP